jgi:hypothetical protein
MPLILSIEQLQTKLASKNNGSKVSMILNQSKQVMLAKNQI